MWVVEGAGRGGGEDVDGGVEGRLWVEGWIVGEVGAGECEALVHGVVGALGGGGVPEKCCIANSLIVCARPMLLGWRFPRRCAYRSCFGVGILDLVGVHPLFYQVS